LRNQLLDYPITHLPDSRAPAAIGRRARLELVFERRGADTVLAHGYAEPPLRVGRVLSLDGAAYVILVCSGPGIFAGDTLDYTIRVGCGAQVVLTSQSALQVHPSPDPAPARIVHEYDVDAGGELYAHWDPVIPFADARLEQRFALRIADDSRLYWSDALMSGRAARGEAWRFRALAHELRLQVSARLAYLERYSLAPLSRSAAGRWAAGDAGYLATALIHSPRLVDGQAEALHRGIEPIPGVRAAVDAVESMLIVGRLAAVTGPPFAMARTQLRQSALELIFERPNLAGRK
jgi:urease accessory protein UreH